MRTTGTLHAILIHIVIATEYIGAQDYLRMCIVNAGARKRNNIARFSLSHIDLTLCTHYIYAYALVDPGSKTIVAAEPAEEEGDAGLYATLNSLKTPGTTFKTLLSVGGGDRVQHRAFKTMSDTFTNAEIFSRNAVAFLRQRNFDGIVIDWALPENTTRLNTILRSLRFAIKWDTRTPKLLLTVKCLGIMDLALQGFEPGNIASTVDYALLLTYHLIRPRFNYTYCTAPLYKRANFDADANLCVKDTIDKYYELGLPYNKMLMGITAMGHYVQLKYGHTHGIGVETQSTILRGSTYNLTSGLAYPEICLFASAGHRYFDQEQKCTYMVDNLEWVGYEDTESIGYKIDFLKNLSLAGIMFSSMDEDDFRGQNCQQGPYPLLNFIKSRTSKSVGSPRTQPPKTTLQYQSSTLGSPTEPPHHPTTTDGSDPEEEGSDYHKTLGLIVLIFVLAVFVVWIVYVFVCRKQPGDVTA